MPKRLFAGSLLALTGVIATCLCHTACSAPVHEPNRALAQAPKRALAQAPKRTVAQAQKQALAQSQEKPQEKSPAQSQTAEQGQEQGKGQPQPQSQSQAQESAPPAGQAQATSAASEVEQKAVSAAQEFLGNKQYNKAVDVLIQALAKEPQNANLHLWLGNVYWAYCNYREAVKEFDLSIQQNAESADAPAHKAVCLARLGYADAAVEIFRTAAKKKTSDATVALLICRALFEAKDYKTSLEYLKDLDDKQIVGPGEVQANIALTRAQDEAALGQLDQAIEEINKILAEHPNFNLAYVGRARIYQKQGQYEKAIADARKAMELKKGRFPMAHLIVGESFLSLGKLGEADQEIFLAIEESGKVTSGEAQHYKALITEKKGNFLGSLPDRALALQLGYIDPPPLTIIGREVLSSDKVFNQFTTVVPTDHFVCYSELKKEKVERFAKIVDGFANYVSANVCPIQGEYPALLFMLPDKGSEQRFLRDRMEFNRGVQGVFLSGRNAVVTFEGSGLGTLMHEVMHKFLYNTKAHDNWADEGVPCFFEKSYGYLYKTGENGPQNLHLITGFPDSGSQFWLWLTRRPLKLSQIVKTAKYADPSHEDEQRLVALFLNHHDKLKQFLALTFKGDPGKYKYFIEAAFNKPLSELDPMFDAYVKSLNDARDAINKLPGTEIFDDKDSFDRFVKDHQIKSY